MIDKEEERCYAVGLYHDGKFVGYFPTVHGYNVYCTSLDMIMVHVSTKEYTTQVCENFRSKYKDYIQFRFEVIDVRKDLFNESGSQSNSKDADKVDSSMSTPESKNNEMFSDMSHGQLYTIAVYNESEFTGYIKKTCQFDAGNTTMFIKDAFVGGMELIRSVYEAFVIRYADSIGYVFDIITVDNALKTSDSPVESEEGESLSETKTESKVELFADMMKHMGYTRVENDTETSYTTDSLFNTDDDLNETELGMDIYAHMYLECVLECILGQLKGNADIDYIQAWLKDVYEERLGLEALFRCKFDGASLYRYRY